MMHTHDTFASSLIRPGRWLLTLAALLSLYPPGTAIGSPLLTPPAMEAKTAATTATDLLRQGQQSLEAGKNDVALQQLRQAATLAAHAKDLQTASQANELISQWVNALPAWVDETLQKAGAIPSEKVGAAKVWAKSREASSAAAEKGDLGSALRLARQAVDLAQENFGPKHATTFMSEREFGTLLTMAGKLVEAEALLNQAAGHARQALGAEHPEKLACDKALAELFEQQGKLPEATKLHQNTRSVLQAKLGLEHPLTIETDLALAGIFKEQGRFDEADALLKESCQRTSALHGYHHLETAKCLERFAQLKMAREAFPEARESFEQAVTIADGITLVDDPTILPMRIGAAEANRRLGELKRADEYLKPVLSKWPTGSGHDPLAIEAFTAQLHLLADQGELSAAETLARKLQKQLTANLGIDHPNTLAMNVELASIQEKQGHLAEAESGLKQTLSRLTQSLGEDHPTTITAMNNLGQLLEEAGLYDDAEPLLRQALEKAQTKLGIDRPSTLTTMNNLALLHESQGNFDKAEPLYQSAIAIYRKRLGEKHVDTLAVVNNLAYLYLLKREYAKAKPLFQQVFDSWNSTLGEQHPRTLKALNNSGRVLHHLGEHDEALKRFQRALELRKKVFGERHPDVIRSMIDSSRLLHDMGRAKEAEEMARQARALGEKVLSPLHPYLFETIEILARILEKGKHPDAFKLRKELFVRRSDFLDRMLWATSDNAREGYIRLHAPELNTHLSILAGMNPAIAGRETLEVGLRRKGLLLKTTSEIRQIVRLGNDPKLKTLSDKLTTTRKKLASLTLAGPTPESANSHLKEIHTLEGEVERLQLELGQASKRFQKSVMPVTIDDLVKHVPEQSALTEFLFYKDGERSGLLAAILRKEQGKPLFDLVVYPDPEGIQKVIIEYRTIIQDEDADEESLKKIGRQAYDRIWAPIRERIGKREQVHVVPDGLLNILPFPALVDPEGDYLTRSTDLHLLSSSRDLVPVNLPEAKGNYLILAGPDYDNGQPANTRTSTALSDDASKQRASDLKQELRALGSGMRGLNFTALPGAEKEGRLIATQASEKKKANTILIKQQAQELSLFTQPKPPEILHIATHGFFLKPDENLQKRLLKLIRGGEQLLPPPGDNPLLRAGLAFSGINANAKRLGEIDTDNDGVLTAQEVLNLDLTGTRLAVLSACETGLGEVHEGEGVYGLRRAFQEAGARTVIASLWEVSDAGTQALMTSLYARLSEGMHPHRALREAQLDLLESNEWHHPYIWAAFMMIGE
ncbi:MAG: tetratricopeptide repeat protein [Magnetococcus sp. YQC-9]